MGKCLVTKLKSVVDNDNLAKLGELVVSIKRVNDATTAYYTNVGMSGNDTVALKTEHNVIDYRSGTAITPTNFADNVGYIEWGMTLAQTGEKTRIANYYALTRLHFSHNTRLADTTPLRWCKHLTTFDHSFSTEIQQACTFDVATINEMSSLQTLKDVNISGDIDDMAVCSTITNLKIYYWDSFDLRKLATKTPNLTTIELPKIAISFKDLGYFSSIANVHVTGTQGDTVEDMVAIARANGRTTGSIHATFASNVKFEGNYIQCPCTIAWDASNITVTRD